MPSISLEMLERLGQMAPPLAVQIILAFLYFMVRVSFPHKNQFIVALSAASGPLFSYSKVNVRGVGVSTMSLLLKFPGDPVEVVAIAPVCD